MEFDGKRAVITGAGGGMGLEIAKELGKRGASVTGVDLKDRSEDFPVDGDFVVADITADGVPEAAIAAAAADGKLDFMVNAAGIAGFDIDGTIEEMRDEVWAKIIEINLTAAMRFSRAAIPAMSEGSAFVHLASVAGLRGGDGPMSAYAVSKAGMVSLSKSLAMELAARWIRSNTICPGTVDTPMVAGIYGEDPSRRDRMVERIPIPRLSTAADIAGAAMYLLSEAASHVSGIDLVVDGGYMNRMP
jgi:NAD(P)-dependent dehydrogenase (short-subunit alcohol dehydrogenase family)